MSLKKRMFRSNMAILFLALLSLLVIMMVVLVTFEDSIEENMLPGMSGYDICRRIRDEIDIPILMVTARAEAVDVIRGLGLGADDYITKPFDPSQLVARVRSHLKRYRRLTEKQAPAGEPERITVKDLVIEPKNWKVWKGGTELKLPNREFELLRFLAENPNLVFSKEELFEKIWGFDYVSDAAEPIQNVLIFDKIQIS